MLSDDEIDAALKTEFQSIVALIDAEITAGQCKVELRGAGVSCNGSRVAPLCRWLH